MDLYTLILHRRSFDTIYSNIEFISTLLLQEARAAYIFKSICNFHFFRDHYFCLQNITT